MLPPRQCTSIRRSPENAQTCEVKVAVIQNSEYKTFIPGIANGSNALSYMSFVAAIITLGKLISSKNDNIRQDHIKKKNIRQKR